MDSLQPWRDFFQGSDSDIFSVLHHAILVAAFDYPDEFRIRRDEIAEKLFSCLLTARCSGCQRVDSSSAHSCEDGAAGSKQSSQHDDRIVSNSNSNCNYSYGDAEALTDIMEEESRIVAEVFRIKELLLNNRDQPDSLLFESLRKLQLMALSVDTIKETGIGKAVNRLKKHGSRQIRQLAETLINLWKVLVDEWVHAANAIAEDTPESVNPSVVDEEEGLPSPPLDEGAFFSTQTLPMEFSQFFDGMDDDGNLQNSGEFHRNRELGRSQLPEQENVVKHTRQKTTTEASAMSRDQKRQQRVRGHEAVVISKPQNAYSGPARPPKHNTVQKVNTESRVQLQVQQKSDRTAIEKQKIQSSDEVAVQRKLELTKRRLQERYQQAENAKRQRTVQVMELHDLPKQGLGHNRPQMKAGNHNRHWARGRK